MNVLRGNAPMGGMTNVRLSPRKNLKIINMFRLV